jgi:RNA polymerase-binding protein DksA
MTTTTSEAWRYQQLLEEKQAQLLQLLRRQDHIAMEKSTSQLDEVQYAAERELAIRNLGRESSLLRVVRTALRRIHGGDFGTCSQCEAPISPRRLATVPWALLCIQCLETADGDLSRTAGPVGEAVMDAA